MTRIGSLAGLAVVLTLPLVMGGCAGALVVGGVAAAAGGGYAAGQERGVAGTVDDLTIKNDIDAALMKQDPMLQAAVSTTVYGGRVLLTGRVPTPEMKAAAAQIASRTHDVRAVYDEVETAPAENLWDDAKDGWITARVRSEMIFDPAIRSINYTIETANGSVYLLGSARSQAELDRATEIARYVPGVRRVVSYVEIRGGMPVAAGPPGPSSGYAGPGNPAAAPRGAVEVQKL